MTPAPTTRLRNPMRRIYTVILFLLAPFVVLRLWWKGRRLPAYRERIGERFCRDAMTPAHYDVWIHAVSLGEVIAVTPLVEALLESGQRLLVTTTTPTGAERVRVRFGERLVHRYLPYDLPFVVRRFLRMTRPDVAVIVETELWPNLINACAQASIPLLLVNARLSERSCRGYRRIRGFIKPVLNQFQAILTQSAADAQRFIALGAEAGRVAVYGNVKFDINVNDLDRQPFLHLQQRWGDGRPVIILASTHDNEEEQVLNRLRHLQQSIPGLLLLIAARHPERFQNVYLLAQRLGFQTGLRSEPDSIGNDTEVVVLDSIGEMMGFYSVSDYAFVGGSLVPVGGHNVLEPIALNVPVLSGRFVHHFRTIMRDLEEARAIRLVDSADELVEELVNLHQQSEAKTALVHQAARVLEENKGALARYFQRIIDSKTCA